MPGLVVFLFGVIGDEAADCMVAAGGLENRKASFGGCCDG